MQNTRSAEMRSLYLRTHARKSRTHALIYAISAKLRFAA